MGKQNRRKMVLNESLNLRKSSLSTEMEKAAGKTAVWRAERKCLSGAFSARTANTLKILAAEL